MADINPVTLAISVLFTDKPEWISIETSFKILSDSDIILSLDQIPLLVQLINYWQNKQDYEDNTEYVITSELVLENIFYCLSEISNNITNSLELLQENCILSIGTVIKFYINKSPSKSVQLIVNGVYIIYNLIVTTRETLPNNTKVSVELIKILSEYLILCSRNDELFVEEKSKIIKNTLDLFIQILDDKEIIDIFIELKFVDSLLVILQEYVNNEEVMETAASFFYYSTEYFPESNIIKFTSNTIDLVCNILNNTVQIKTEIATDLIWFWKQNTCTSISPTIDSYCNSNQFESITTILLEIINKAGDAQSLTACLHILALLTIHTEKNLLKPILIRLNTVIRINTTLNRYSSLYLPKSLLYFYNEILMFLTENSCLLNGNSYFNGMIIPDGILGTIFSFSSFPEYNAGINRYCYKICIEKCPYLANQGLSFDATARWEEFNEFISKSKSVLKFVRNLSIAFDPRPIEFIPLSVSLVNLKSLQIGVASITSNELIQAFGLTTINQYANNSNSRDNNEKTNNFHSFIPQVENIRLYRDNPDFLMTIDILHYLHKYSTPKLKLISVDGINTNMNSSKEICAIEQFFAVNFKDSNGPESICIPGCKQWIEDSVKYSEGKLKTMTIEFSGTTLDPTGLNSFISFSSSKFIQNLSVLDIAVLSKMPDDINCSKYLSVFLQFPNLLDLSLKFNRTIEGNELVEHWGGKKFIKLEKLTLYLKPAGIFENHNVIDTFSETIHTLHLWAPMGYKEVCNTIGLQYLLSNAVLLNLFVLSECPITSEQRTVLTEWENTGINKMGKEQKRLFQLSIDGEEQSR